MGDSVARVAAAALAVGWRLQPAAHLTSQEGGGAAAGGEGAGGRLRCWAGLRCIKSVASTRLEPAGVEGGVRELRDGRVHAVLRAAAS